MIEAVAAEIPYRKIDTYNIKSIERDIKFMANIIADIIIDTVSTWESFDSNYAEAQALFFIKELSLLSYRASACFSSFVWINYNLWGKKSNYFEKLNTLMKKKCYIPQEIKKFDMASCFPNFQNPSFFVPWLKDNKNWSLIATTIAQLFIPFLPKDPEALPIKGNTFDSVFGMMYEKQEKMIRLGLNQGHVGDTDNLSVTPLTYQPVAPLYMPNLSQIHWSEVNLKPGNFDNRQIELQQAHHFFEIPVSPKSGNNFLPDLSFWIDSSGSMGFDPISKRGNYDICLRAVFGIFSWLSNYNLSNFINFSVVNFSGTTLFSG